MGVGRVGSIFFLSGGRWLVIRSDLGILKLSFVEEGIYLLRKIKKDK
jgi:hypothetical protein